MIFANYKPANNTNGNNNNEISYEILNIHLKNFKINFKKYSKSLEEREKAYKQATQFNGAKISKFNFYENNFFDNFSEESSLIKEDIINWFFSLTLEERMKIVTIENSTAVEVFQQMNNYLNYDRNASFSFILNSSDFHEENSVLKKSEKETFLHPMQMFNTNSFLENNFEGFAEYKSPYDSALNSLFSYKSQDNKYDENFSFFKSLLSENIYVFSVHSDLDCISLSPKLLEDKKEFLKYFNYFSYDKSFTELVELVTHRKNKTNYFSLPAWVRNEYNPSVAILLALIEQVIIIKFILNYGKNLNNVDFQDLIFCGSKAFKSDKDDYYYDNNNNNNRLLENGFVSKSNNAEINADIENNLGNKIICNCFPMRNNHCNSSGNNESLFSDDRNGLNNNSNNNNNNDNNYNRSFLAINNDTYRNSSSNKSLVFSLINEVKLSEFFERRKNLIFFLAENYPKTIKIEHLEYSGMISNYSNNNNNNNNNTLNNNTNNSNDFKAIPNNTIINADSKSFYDNLENLISKKKDPEFLINTLNIPQMLNDININKTINDLILSKNRYSEKAYKSYFSSRFNNSHNINFKSLKLFIIGKDEFETEKNFLAKYKEDIILFFDYLVFYNIELIWKKEYFLCKEIYKKIYNLYTEKNALDLLNEMERDLNEVSFNSNNKKAKNNKKSGSNNKANSNNNKKIENNYSNNNYVLNNNNNSNNMYNKNICTNNNCVYVNNNNNNNNLYDVNIYKNNFIFSDEFKKENFNYYKPYLGNNTFFKASELNDPFLLQKSEMSNYYKDNVMTRNCNKIEIVDNVNSNNNQNNNSKSNAINNNNNNKKQNKLKSKSTSREKHIKKYEKNKGIIIKDMIRLLIDKSVETSFTEKNYLKKESNLNSDKSIKQKFLDSMENNENLANKENLETDLVSNLPANENKDCLEELIFSESKQDSNNINNNKNINLNNKKNNNLSINNEKIKVKIIKNYFACSEDLLIAEKKTRKLSNLVGLNDEEEEEEENKNPMDLNKNLIGNKNNFFQSKQNLAESNELCNSKLQNEKSDANKFNDKSQIYTQITHSKDAYYQDQNEEHDKNSLLNASVISNQVNNEIDDNSKTKKKKKTKQQKFYKISSKKQFKKAENQANQHNETSSKNNDYGNEYINLEASNFTNTENNNYNNLNKLNETKKIKDDKDKNCNKKKNSNINNNNDQNNKYNNNKDSISINKQQKFKEKSNINTSNKTDFAANNININNNQGKGLKNIINNNYNNNKNNEEQSNKNLQAKKGSFKINEFIAENNKNNNADFGIVNNNSFYVNNNNNNNSKKNQIKQNNKINNDTYNDMIKADINNPIINQNNKTKTNNFNTNNNQNVLNNTNNINNIRNEKQNKSNKNINNNASNNFISQEINYNNNSINNNNNINNLKNKSNYRTNSDSFNNRENAFNNISYYIPNFNPNLNLNINNINNINNNNNNSGMQENYNNLSFRKNSFNNISQLSNHSNNQLKQANISNSNISPYSKHKNSFNCKDNRKSSDIEFILNNMNSTANQNNSNFNNKNTKNINTNLINISQQNNYNTSNNNNQNINININNNTNYFNFNIDPHSNQFFSEYEKEYEKAPRKRSHNIPTGNFSTAILEQIANSSGNPMHPGINLHFNNFVNTSNLYGKLIESMGANLANKANIGLAGRFDIPSFNQFANFSPFNSTPIINFNFNNNITAAPAANYTSNNLGFLNNNSLVNNNNNSNNNTNLNSINSQNSFNFINNNFNSIQKANFYNATPNNISNNANVNSNFSCKNNINNNTDGKLNLFNQDYVPFTCKLHNDILDYLNDVTKIVEVLKPVKLNIVANIENMLKQFLDYEITIDVFGSFASDLSIESSDIDLKVNILHENSDAIDYDRIIFSLVKFFNEKNLFENVTPIHTASIPIIKLLVDPRKIVNDDNLLIFEEFRNSHLNKNFKFNKEELNKFKIDLTFLDLIKKQQNSLDSINFAKNNINLFPEIKPILFILKRLLQEKNLNSAFNGGLSSYSIFLLILSYIKFKNNTLLNNNNINYGVHNSNGKIEYNSTYNNLGVLILDFLECYGKHFEFHLFSIDVNQANPFIFTNHCYDNCPIILDPINYHNASKTSFRIDEVKDFLGKAYDYLISCKANQNKKELFNNIIYDLILLNK